MYIVPRVKGVKDNLGKFDVKMNTQIELQQMFFQLRQIFVNHRYFYLINFE